MSPAFHVIAGLPRSGSTLLCNLLAQRPETHVSSTSALPRALLGMSQLFTQSPEVTSDLLNVPGTQERPARVMRSIVESWYSDVEADVVVDKSRGWGQSALLLGRLLPEAVILVTVRDPREVIASIERQHRATAEYGSHDSFESRNQQMLSAEGLVGGPIAWCEDMIRRKLPNVKFVRYTSLVADTRHEMRDIDRRLGLEEFDYDINDVVSVATDADALYRFKYPHDGSGQVAARGADWSDVMSDETAQRIVQAWPLYSSTFGFH